MVVGVVGRRMYLDGIFILSLSVVVVVVVVVCGVHVGDEG